MADSSTIFVQADLFYACWLHARDAMMVVDCTTGMIMEANPATEDLTGYDREELISASFCRFFLDKECNQVKEMLRKGSQHSASLDDFNFQRKDGQSLAILVSSAATSDDHGQPMVLCVLREMNELERQRHRLATLQWALSAYAGAALALGRVTTTEELLREICAAITHDSIYVLAWVGLAEETPEKLVRVLAAAGPAVSYLDGLQVSWDESKISGQGPTGRSIRSGELQIMQNRENTPSYLPWKERAEKVDIFSSMTVPLTVDGLWRGALMVYAGCPNAFEPVAIEVFEHLSSQIVHGLITLHQKEQLETERAQRFRAQERLTEAFSAMVAALVTAVETRDPYTAGHENRVAVLANAIGEELGWDEDRLTGLRMAAMVHDIGKISIPSRILVKPGRLNDEEYAIIKTHPETGYIILKDIPFNWPVAEIMRQHHEKQDGSGYPRGLKGDEILPEARVLIVADMVEAMASDRPYRTGIALDVVLNEMDRMAGVQLDAEVVRACLRLFREKDFVLPRAESNL
jgi:PAS domain S-box-containing protein